MLPSVLHPCFSSTPTHDSSILSEKGQFEFYLNYSYFWFSLTIWSSQAKLHPYTSTPFSLIFHDLPLPMRPNFLSLPTLVVQKAGFIELFYSTPDRPQDQYSKLARKLRPIKFNMMAFYFVEIENCCALFSCKTENFLLLFLIISIL